MVCALYRRNVLIGMVARLASRGPGGGLLLSVSTFLCQKLQCKVLLSGAYTSHHHQGLNSHNIVLLLVATL